MANESIIQKYNVVKGRTPISGGIPTGDFFLTKLMNNPKYRTIITLPKDMGSVVGYCDSQFAFQGKADYKPIADLGQIEDAASAVFAGKQAISSAINPDGYSDEQLAQLSFKQIRGTELRYAGSATPVFQMKIILPSYDASAKQSPLDSVRLLMKCVYPSFVNTEHAGQMLQAPLGYGIRGAAQQADDTAVGTCTISRGQYFCMPESVITSVSSTFSSECMVDGYPLFVEVNIEWVPWRCPSYDQAMSWFKI